MDLSYIINELGEDSESYFNAVSPPIVQTSNFSFKTVDDFRAALSDEMGGYLYSRGLNPTTDILRKKLAALDGAEECLVFGSGAAAIFAGVFSQVKGGDHIVSVRNPYSWAQKLFDSILPRFGITTTYVDGREIENFEKALLPNTTFIYLESPNSWNYELQDLSAVAALAKSRGITTMIDNSYCTPLYQKPIEFGIDLVMQTATKYIGGHSDTLGGVLSGSREKIEKLFNLEFLSIGSTVSPFSAWLLLRGLRTLPTRLDRITSTSTAVVNFLKEHQKIRSVIFPLSADFPQRDLVQKQMKGGCGLFTISLQNNSWDSIQTFCEKLKRFRMAVSWGGHESLVIPRIAGIRKGDFNFSDEEQGYIRLYTGLEDADYLISDLEQALDAL